MRMNKRSNRILSLLLTLTMLLSVGMYAVTAWAAEADGRVTTTPTGYTEATQVVYESHTEGKHTVLANWGARGEDCVFLSPNAEDYYATELDYDSLSDYAGGTTQSNAAQSELYAALQDMMEGRHTYITGYQETRYLYRYTDCVRNDTAELVSFYSGVLHNATWDAGATWNREHTWPNSKGMNGSDEDDIMMLRPTLKSENGSRGNKAYGESAGYFDPGVSVRGDCARIVLYIYVRWGNTGRMWGTSGVMENVDILLKWMAEDPVDTWEMGRNDSVESITGVRNVFVDYPEYAWLLFGREVPQELVTPSGMAQRVEDTTESVAVTEPETTVAETTVAETTVAETTVAETTGAASETTVTVTTTAEATGSDTVSDATASGTAADPSPDSGLGAPPATEPSTEEPSGGGCRAVVSCGMCATWLIMAGCAAVLGKRRANGRGDGD